MPDGGADGVSEPEDLGTASQALSLGSAVGSPVALPAGTPISTCGLNNGVTPGCTSSNASDISFVWTAPYAGYWTFTTSGSSFDTVLVIAPYSSPSSQIVCEDVVRSTGGESASRTLTAGQQIIITIDGYASLCGNYKLNILAPVCTIGGQTYQNGQLNPANACQKCSVTQSLTSWSNNDGAWIQAGGGGYCKYNTCIAGGCATPSYCSTHTAACDGVCQGGTAVTACGDLSLQ